MVKENINITIPAFILEYIDKEKESGVFSSRSHAFKRMAQFWMAHNQEEQNSIEGVPEDV